MSRKPIFAANWKLNKTLREAIDFVTIFKRLILDAHSADLVICPPFTALAEVSELLIESDIKLGAQDIFWEEKGAFTGEVSATLVKDAGARYAIIGHSERRQFFHETNESVNKKIKAAVAAGLFPIVCVGETLKERESGKTFKVLEEQLKGGFAELDASQISQVVIAYEPVWAIGTGKVATPAQAQEAHAYIRKFVTGSFGEESSKNLRIQYGGSVKPDNISDLMHEADIDGALVGGASLDANTFAELIHNANKNK